MFSVRVADPFADPRPLEDPDILVQDVEKYIALILDYLERHEMKSVLLRRSGHMTAAGEHAFVCPRLKSASI